MRIAKTIALSDGERLTLMKWARGRSTPSRLVQRAKIILAAAGGMRNDEIAGELGCTRRTVGTWRSRFAKQRLKGIEKRCSPRGTHAVGPRRQRGRNHRQDDAGNAGGWHTLERPHDGGRGERELFDRSACLAR